MDREIELNKPKRDYKKILRQNLLTILMIVCILTAIGIGVGVRHLSIWNARNIMYVKFPSEIFLRLLKLLILPLIVCSIISSIASLDTKLIGKLGIRSLIYYLTTTVMAILLGICLVTVIGPGKGSKIRIEISKKPKAITTEDSMMDLLRNLFPPNIIEATIYQTSTILIDPNKTATEITNITDYYSWKISKENVRRTNILGCIMFSILIGLTLSKMEEASKSVLDFFTCFSDIMLDISTKVIWLSPFGVMFLIIGEVVQMEDMGAVAAKVAMYTGTVILALLIHFLCVLPALYFLMTRKNPYKFMYGMSEAMVTAFATSSSSATLPITISCANKKNNIDIRIAKFCLPIGATINMDGTALYEAVASIFIAQLRQIPMDPGKIAAVSIMATAASIGAAGIPQAGLVTMVMVLNAIGLPAEDVALIFVVDWFLDRWRTTVNVMGDSFGAGILAYMSRNDLQKNL